jgi:large subunit ribosomal protein L25
MEEVVLQAEKRDTVGKRVNALRRTGKLPAVVYGRGVESMPIMLDLHDSSKVLNSLASSAIINIDVAGNRYPVLVKEKQRDIIRGTLKHIDFLVISMEETLRLQVGLEFTGEAPAIDEGGILVYGLEALEVEALPKDLPETIAVDISGLKEIGDAIFVRDVAAPEGVKILAPEEEMVVQVNAPMAAPVEEEEEEEELVVEEEEEPEVIEKGKREGEEF